MSLHSTTKSRRFVAAILTSALTALFALTPTSSARAAATEVTKFTLKGVVVDGFSDTTDGCLARSTSVHGGDDGTGNISVFYVATVYDTCAGAYQSFVLGHGTPTTYKVAGNLDSIHVVVTIPLENVLTDEPDGQIALDETWTATGPAVKSKSSETQHLPGGYYERSQFVGTFRTARATGTVSLSPAQMGRQAASTFTVTHP